MKKAKNLSLLGFDRNYSEYLCLCVCLCLSTVEISSVSNGFADMPESAVQRFVVGIILPERKWDFFLSEFPFTNIYDSQDSRGRGKAISLTPLYHFHPLKIHLDISWVITAESSPLHIASNRTQTGILWFPKASRWWKETKDH